MQPDNKPSDYGNRELGAVVGAALTAVLRFLVTAGFLYWGFGGSQSGGGWMTLALVSALIGLVVGAIAGWTCQPTMGALLGAALSGASCFGLGVVPGLLGTAMIRDRGEADAFISWLIGALIAMIIAGGIAGGIGAGVGKRSQKWR